MGYLASTQLDSEEDLQEMQEIIETIPNIELSSLPGENFLHFAYPGFQKYQALYHQRQE
jgi:hypothetical protein